MCKYCGNLLLLNRDKNRLFCVDTFCVLNDGIILRASSVNITDSNRVDLDNNRRTFRVEILDYIPMVSIVSGVARTGFGALQIYAAAAQSTVSLVDFCFHPSRGSSIDDGTSWYLQGKANMLRGSIAIWPVLGNITLYLYDHSSLAKDWERRQAGINVVGL